MILCNSFRFRALLHRQLFLFSKSHYINSFSTSSVHNKSAYSHTVILPKTSFPQRVEGEKRIQLDRKIVGSKPFQEIYQQQFDQRSKDKNKEFILHDGPPYANGEPHLGHAVNKILKDITNRWKMVQGYRVQYRPGWDCHGLPIELRARQEQKSKQENKTDIEIREMARQFAAMTLQIQKREFMSWGVMGDWDNPYTTMAPDFVKNQLKVFLKLYENKTLFQRYMPVYWSPSSKTALAESELEYNLEHKSKSIYVRFSVKQDTNFFKRFLNLQDTESKVYLLVWTTTPWTLVANKAICVKSDASYCAVKKGDDYYILARELLNKNIDLSQIFLEGNPNVLDAHIPGKEMTSLLYEHPLWDYLDSISQVYPVLTGDHVTLDAGTGLVHTAPAHGPEDYLVGIRNNLDLTCLVDELGCYDSQTHPDIKGKFVLEEGNQKILELLNTREHILLQKEIQHSYPYDWRTKKPVILRASKQWFVDTKSLQEKGLKCLQAIEIHPKFAANGFQGVLENRPYWCVSRQRVWGVPIPVFYDSENKEIVSKEIVERCCQMINEHGTDFWWKLTTPQILDGLEIENIDTLTKGKDIFDVWLDSGLTWHNVIQDDLKTSITVVDLYLEGLDQFSGWFYSSLLTSLALQGCAPYKKIFVHGFTLDEKGRKMSKSLGNVIAPSNITEGKAPTTTKKASKGVVYGVDVLRWWVAAHGSQSSAINVGKNLLDQCKQDVDRLRNVTKFLLGNLPQHMDESKCLSLEQLLPFDQYMLHLLANHQESVSGHFDNFHYNKVCLAVNHFVSNHLSAFYFHLIKDRLYCDDEASLSRRSAVTTLWHILNVVRCTMSPITPLMIAEMSEHLPSLQTIPTDNYLSDIWIDKNLARKFDVLIQVKSSVANALRESDTFKNKDSKQIEFLFDPSQSGHEIQQSFNVVQNTKELEEFFQSSAVHFLVPEKNDSEFEIFETKSEAESGASSFKFGARESCHYSCPRCRQFTSNVENELCSRCSSVVI